MSKRLYVGNIPYDVTQAELRDFFHPHDLTEVKICTDRETGRPRGFGFVELPSEEAAADAVRNLDGTQLGGRTIRVNIAEEKPRGGGKDRRDNSRRRDNR